MQRDPLFGAVTKSGGNGKAQRRPSALSILRLCFIHVEQRGFFFVGLGVSRRTPGLVMGDLSVQLGVQVICFTTNWFV